MANLFYSDKSGQKCGPVTLAQVKDLVAKGVITRKTPMETEEGHNGLAEQINELFP